MRGPTDYAASGRCSDAPTDAAGDAASHNAPSYADDAPAGRGDVLRRSGSFLLRRDSLRLRPAEEASRCVCVEHQVKGLHERGLRLG